jgi:hypothetical protein
MATNGKIILFLVALSQLCAAVTNQDTVFVVHKKIPYDNNQYLLDIDILYYRTDGVLRKIHTFGANDASELKYYFRYNNDTLDYDCITWYNNSSDCSYHIFLDRKTKIFYVTKQCTTRLKLERSNVNFNNRTVVLYSYTFDGNNKVIRNVKKTTIEDKTREGKGILDGDEIKGRVLVKLLPFPEGFDFNYYNFK